MEAAHDPRGAGATTLEVGRPDRFVQWLDQTTNDDVARVGGKNASLGEMIQRLGDRGSAVPIGFATTAHAYRDFLRANDLDGRIAGHLRDLHDGTPLAEVGAAVRRLILDAEFPDATADAIRAAYEELGVRLGRTDPDVAVRSSATAEDLPDASFAGQQETYLNVVGPTRCSRPAAAASPRCSPTGRSATARTTASIISKVALTVGVQRDGALGPRGSSASCSPLDTETGFPGAVLIDAAYGLGENVVQGRVDPDEYAVFKPPLDDERLTPILSKTSGSKEQKIVYPTRGSGSVRPERRHHRQRNGAAYRARRRRDPQARPLGDCDRRRTTAGRWTWSGPRTARPANSYIVQARPETVQSRKEPHSAGIVPARQRGEVLVTGRSVGDEIATGRVRVTRRAPTSSIGSSDGEVLVTDKTDPDWEPIMKKAARDRHQPRRAHLPRGHRQPRTGRAGDRRHRSTRTRGTRGRPDRHRELRRRRRPGSSTTAILAFDVNATSTSTRLADDPHQGDDEPRQSRGGVLAVLLPTDGRRPGADGVHRQHPHQDPSAGARPTSTSSPIPATSRPRSRG